MRSAPAAASHVVAAAVVDLRYTTIDVHLVGDDHAQLAAATSQPDQFTAPGVDVPVRAAAGRDRVVVDLGDQLYLKPRGFHHAARPAGGLDILGDEAATNRSGIVVVGGWSGRGVDV